MERTGAPGGQPAAGGGARPRASCCPGPRGHPAARCRSCGPPGRRAGADAVACWPATGCCWRRWPAPRRAPPSTARSPCATRWWSSCWPGCWAICTGAGPAGTHGTACCPRCRWPRRCTAGPSAELRRQQPPAWALGFLKALGDDQGILLVRLEQTELGVFRLFGVSPPGGAARSARAVPAGQHRGRRADRRLLAAAAALAAGDQAGGGRPALRRRRLRLGRAAGQRGRPACPASWPTTPTPSPSGRWRDELLYYGHERPHEGHKRTHGILIDASASMRGAREVVARGLGLALAKKLALMGGEVWLSFFDSRLHRRVEAGRAGRARAALPALLPLRAGAQLRPGVRRAARRAGPPGRDVAGRQVAITFITHGECHIPAPIMQALRRHAAVYGIFVLPSQPLDLEYLPLLSRAPGHLRRVHRPSGRAPAAGPGRGPGRRGQHARRHGLS